MRCILLSGISAIGKGTLLRLTKRGNTLGVIPMAATYGSDYEALENLGKRLQLMYYDDNDWIAENPKSAIGIYTTEENCRQCTSSAHNCDHCCEVLLHSLGFVDAESREKGKERYSLLLRLIKQDSYSAREVLGFMACVTFYYLRDKGSVERAKDKCSRLLDQGKLAHYQREDWRYRSLEQFYDTT